MAIENKTTEVFEEGALNKCGKEIVARNTTNDVLGGYLASRFGGKRVILATILGSSLLTLASPVAARTHAYILAGLRVAIGFLQGATFPAMHTMWSVWGPPLELSVLTGAQIGNVFVLPLSGFLCQYGFDGGWPSIFYTLGVIGVIWCGVWTYVITDRPSDHPRISEAEKEYITKAVEASTGKRTGKHPDTPWGSILSSRAVWACWFGHFAGDWGAYTMLVSLPSFLKDVLGLDLSSLGMVSAVPYVAYFVVINIGGFLADFIRSRKILGTLNTRRAAMLIALLGQAMFLVLSGYCGCGQEVLVIVYLTAGMAISGLQYSGFVVNYLDIAPSFSGTIMGMGNTISCLAGIVSPMVTSALTPNGTQEEWQGVLWLTAGILATGSIVFSIFASGEVQEWARHKGGDGPEELPLKEAEAMLEKDTH
ncbi:transporter, major facilitator family protein [Ostertagia ostertagi]